MLRFTFINNHLLWKHLTTHYVSHKHAALTDFLPFSRMKMILDPFNPLAGIFSYSWFFQVFHCFTVQHRSFFAIGRKISQCIMGVALMHWIINSPTSLLGLFSFRSFVVELEKNDVGTPILNLKILKMLKIIIF